MSSRQRTVSQHIVPQWYLKRFASNSGQLIVLDRIEQKKYVRNVKTVAVVNHFYDIDHPTLPIDYVEQQLSRIEGAASSVVPKLVRHGADSLTPEQRFKVAEFLSAQYLRGEDQQKFADMIADAMFKATAIMSSDEQLRAEFVAQYGPMAEEDLSSLVAQARDPDSYRVSRPKAVVQLMAENLPGFAYGLCVARTWQVHRYEQPVLFTGDVPLQLWADGEPAGIANADEITIALDPHHLLVLSQRPDLDADDNMALTNVQGTPERLVRHLRLVGAAAHRSVFVPTGHLMANVLRPPAPSAPPAFHEQLIELARAVRQAHERA